MKMGGRKYSLKMEGLPSKQEGGISALCDRIAHNISRNTCSLQNKLLILTGDNSAILADLDSPDLLADLDPSVQIR